MSRRRKCRADGTPVPRSFRSSRPEPGPAELEWLEALTDALPEPLRAFRDLSLLSAPRRYALERAIAERLRSPCIVLHGVHDPHNQAAVVRTSEAMGLQEVHVVGAPGASWRPSERVTQSAHRWVDIHHHSSFETAAELLRESGRGIMAAAIVEGATSLHELDASRPMALVLGSEARGLSRKVVEACDGAFSIQLYGLTASLNVSVAAAMILAHAVEGRRRALGGRGDLSEAEKMELRRRFYKQAARKVPPSLLARLEE